MIEPLAVAVHAVRRYAADMTGKKAVVLGGGPIGNLVAQTAKALGAEVVLLSELSAYSLIPLRSAGSPRSIRLRKICLKPSSKLAGKTGLMSSSNVLESTQP